MLCETQGSEEALFSRFWLFWRPAGVPTAHAAFCGLCCNLSVFYDFIFCFFHYNLILRTAQSLQSFFRHSLFASHYLYLYQVVPIFLFFCVRPFGCVEPNRWLHSNWHFRGYLLKHRFRSAQTFLIVPTMPSCNRSANAPL